MLLSILAISQKPPAWAQLACDDYIKRFKRPFELSVLDLPLAKRSGSSNKEQWLAQEYATFQKHLQAGTLVIPLDVTGTSISTENFAKQLAIWQPHYSKATFLIGGPDGLDPRCIHKADFRLSLSALTLTHTLAKVLLVEQLYRAYSLIVHLPYHRSS